MVKTKIGTEYKMADLNKHSKTIRVLWDIFFLVIVIPYAVLYICFQSLFRLGEHSNKK